jgi:hypothetical protein
MTPDEPVQKQLEAYNAHDLEGFVAQYSDDIEVFRPPSPEPVLSGKIDFASHYERHRFNIPNLQASLVSRTISGNIVIDLESIVGLGTEVLTGFAVYEVERGLIRRVWFF